MTDQTTTAEVADQVEKKPRAPRRTSTLMVGIWSDRAFIPAKTQPSGKAQKDLKTLRAWLRKPEVAKAMAEEMIETLDVIRKELVSAKFESISLTKVTVK